MKTLIIYSTKHGSTGDVAMMIADGLDSPEIINVNEFHEDSIADYDQVIIGTPIYAGKGNQKIVNFIEKFKDHLLGKKVGLFVCGMVEGEEKRRAEIEAVYSEQLIEHAVACDFLGGAIKFSKLNFAEKAIIKMILKSSDDHNSIDAKKVADFAKYFK